jgi:hypothetical protein
VGVARRQLQAAGSALAALERVLVDLVCLSADLEAALGELKEELIAAVGGDVRHARSLGVGWQRYLLCWGVLRVISGSLHGHTRARRARSIKRRRVKRLVRQTHFRF